MIRGFWGPVGSGKSYTGAYNAQEELGKGRPVAATWSIHGCKQLFTLADALSDEARGFRFLVDEVGGKFSSRKPDNLDEIAMHALQQSRHNLVDCDMFGQHPRQLDIVARELIAEHHFCKMVGFSGEDEHRTGKRSSWKHPWAIFVRVWGKDDFDESWKPLRSARHWYLVPWLRRVAGCYNSWDRIVPDDVADWLAGVQSTAHIRFAVPPAVVRDSKVIPQILPEGFTLMMPNRKALRSKDRQSAGEAVPASANFMAGMGLYHHDSPDAPGSALVVGAPVLTRSPVLPLSGPDPALCWESAAPARGGADDK